MMMININLKHWLYMESIYDDDHVWHLPSVIRFLACDCRLRWVARWIRDHDLQVGITILLSLFYLDGDHLRISTYLCFFSLNGDLLIGRLNRLESGWNTELAHNYKLIFKPTPLFTGHVEREKPSVLRQPKQSQGEKLLPTQRTRSVTPDLKFWYKPTFQSLILSLWQSCAHKWCVWKSHLIKLTNVVTDSPSA